LVAAGYTKQLVAALNRGGDVMAPQQIILPYVADRHRAVILAKIYAAQKSR
jgi:hypothetical protein